MNLPELLADIARNYAGRALDSWTWDPEGANTIHIRLLPARTKQPAHIDDIREQAVAQRKHALRGYHHHECPSSYSGETPCTCADIWRAKASEAGRPESVRAPE